VAGRSHLSIGEVLSLLHDEFPDVTISKIRFLESQGLVDPERTPSGYRKFYETDIERLRWVLRQQRDAFLPLKVIKGRLDNPGEGLCDDDTGPVAGDLGDDVAEGEVILETFEAGPGTAELVAGAPRVEVGGDHGTATVPAAQLFDAGPPHGNHEVPGGRDGPGYTVAGADRPGGPRRGQGAERGPAHRSAGRQVGKASQAGTPDGRGHAVTEPVPGRAGVGPQRTYPTELVREVIVAPDEDELTLEELVEEAAVDVETVRDLERYGLITPRVLGGARYYTRDAAIIAQLASAFARHGVEARHLRAFKGAADREAGLVQQVRMPLIRQRNPEARQAAAQAVEELSHLGGELRAALLRAALADLR